MFLRKYLGSIISLPIMPSQTYDEDMGANQRHIYYVQYQRRLPHDTIKITNKTIASTYGAQLDACEISPKIEVDPNDRKVIIHGMGNGDFYENHFHEFIHESKAHNVTVVAFNFRNVLKSKGKVTSEEDLIDDVMAVIEHYRKQGVKTENILLNGHSLGAAVLTMAAARLWALDKQKNSHLNPKDIPSVKLLNTRSFSTLAKEITLSLLGGVGSAVVCGLLCGSILGLGLGFKVGLSVLAGFVASGYALPSLPQSLLTPVIDGLLWTMFGRMDALSAYKALPENAKDHITAKNDLVIKPQAALHAGLKYEKTKVKEELAQAQLQANHDLIAQLESKLLNLKDCKVVFRSESIISADAHNYPLNYLNTYHKLRAVDSNSEPQITGQQVMDNKIQSLFNLR